MNSSYLTLLDSFPAPVWQTGKDSRRTYFNRGWLDFTGRTLDEELGNGWTERVHPDDLDTVLDTCMVAVEQCRPFTLEYRLRHHSGEYRWICEEAKPFYDEDGYYRGYFGFCYDLSDRIRLETEKLRTSKMESLGVLAGGIAHDFNNLLTPILLNLTIAGEQLDASAADTRHLLDEAREAANRARHLTRQLLTFAEGGNPVRKTVQVPRLMEESVRFALAGSHVEPRFESVGDLIAAHVDAGQVSEAVRGLVINAVQAMKHRGRLHIRTRRVTRIVHSRLPAKMGNFVRIDIEDNGPGIDPGIIDKIFDPYFTTKHTGNGLGLAATQSIVRKHAGYLAVESVPGGGATFSIFLPAADPANLPRRHHKSPSPAQARSGSQSGTGEPRARRRLLVMDDEPLVRRGISATLEKLGYDVETACHGEEAIAVYCAARDLGQPIDLTLMDLTIQGGMGGKEAIAALRELDPDARAVVCSGYSNDPIMANHEDYGFCGAIQKPFAPEELSRLVSELMEA